MTYSTTTGQGHHESPSSLALGAEGKGLTLLGCAAKLTIYAASWQVPASAHYGLHCVPKFQGEDG